MIAIGWEEEKKLILLGMDFIIGIKKDK